MPNKDNTIRVLVVDDDCDGADSLGMIIEELGHQVHVTYGGTQALDVAAAFRPDLMLIDLVMPHSNGSDLVARFRQNPAFPQTKIVAITGIIDEEHKSLAKEAGFDLLLLKPVNLPAIEALLSCVVPTALLATQSPPLPSALVWEQRKECRLRKPDD